MMSELRWALLILGVLFIAALWWWERRRPRQASGALDRTLSREGGADAPPRLVREPPLTLPEVRAREPMVAKELPVVAERRAEQPEAQESPQAQESAEAREPELPVLEAAGPARPAEAAERQPAPTATEPDDTVDDLLAIVPADEIPADERAVFRESEFEDSQFEDSGFGDTEPVAAVDAEHVAAPAVPLQHEVLPELPPSAPPVVDWPADRERRILALRLVAPQRERFAGRSLRQALAAEGFLLGQFDIFHKPDDEHRAVLSAASLTRPGTFDMETMDSQHYGGLSLFAVLPGPRPPSEAFDELVFAARNLNERLHGVLQDEQGTPLTPARIAQLREQLRDGASS
jgi:cell division protein ZipA